MRKTLIIIALLIVTTAAGWGLWATLKPAAPENAPATTTAATGDIESVVTAQGTLEPKDYVDVGAQVSGKIETMHVEIGDNVKSGDPIAAIDSAVYEAQLAGEQARLKTLEAQKAEREALLKQAQQKADRNEKLLKQKALSKEAAEDSQTTLAIQQAQLDSLAAQIDEAQSAIETAQTNLGYTQIFAPMDGTVVSQSVKEGQTINANQTAPVIVQIANLDVMTVRAQVAEADISKLKEGTPLTFSTLGGAGKKWNGKIRQILPTPEIINDVVLYNVLADIDNTDRQLMNGMTVQLFFVLGEAKNVTTIPATALLRRLPKDDTDAGQAYQIRVPGKGNKEELRTIIVGLTSRTQAQVIDGLSPGDKILLPAAAPSGNNAQRPPGGMRMGRL
jgi:macrolide-specific efflux system membrane fusion protein